jgi:hypothetical protein
VLITLVTERHLLFLRVSERNLNRGGEFYSGTLGILAPALTPEEPRAFRESLEDTVQAVSRASGARVRVTTGMGQPEFERSNFGAAAEPARSALLRLFDQQRDRATSGGPGICCTVPIGATS